MKSYLCFSPSKGCFVKALVVLLVHESLLLVLMLDQGAVALPKGVRSLEMNSTTTVERNLLPPIGNTKSELPTPASQSIPRSNICFPYFISRNISTLLSQAIKMLQTTKDEQKKAWLQLFIKRLASIAKELHSSPAVQKSKCLEIRKKAQSKASSNKNILGIDLSTLPEDVQLRNAKILFNIEDKWQNSKTHETINKSNNVDETGIELKKVKNQTSSEQQKTLNSKTTQNPEFGTTDDISHSNHHDDKNHKPRLVGGNIELSDSNPISKDNKQRDIQKPSNVRSLNLQTKANNYFEIAPNPSTFVVEKEIPQRIETPKNHLEEQLPSANQTNENIFKDDEILRQRSEVSLTRQITPNKILNLLRSQQAGAGIKSKRYHRGFPHEIPQLTINDSHTHMHASNQNGQSNVQYLLHASKPAMSDESKTDVPNTNEKVNVIQSKEDDLVQQLHFRRQTKPMHREDVVISKPNPRGTINVKVWTLASTSDNFSEDTPVTTETISSSQVQELLENVNGRGDATDAWNENSSTKDELSDDENNLDFDYEELGAAAGEIEADDNNARDRTVAPSPDELKNSKEKQTTNESNDDDLVRQFHALKYLNNVENLSSNVNHNQVKYAKLSRANNEIKKLSNSVSE